MKQLPLKSFQKVSEVIVAGLLSTPIVLYGIAQGSRPPRTNEARSAQSAPAKQLLFQGITYQREARSLPRPIMIHVVTIDLSAPGIGIFVTPGIPAATPADKETDARTTSEFVKDFNVQLAVNANFFYPFREEAPWDFYPHTGDPTNNVGQVISNGNAYSPGQANWAAICFSAQNRAQIVESGACPVGTQQAVSGNEMLVKNGKPVSLKPEVAKTDKPYPRTAVALDKTSQKLWLVIVDGKQFQYSEGVTIAELSNFIANLGADSALNLDGGGSVTLAMQTQSGVKVLNAPIQTRIPMRERPIATHLGFFAQRSQ